MNPRKHAYMYTGKQVDLSFVYLCTYLPVCPEAL